MPKEDLEERRIVLPGFGKLVKQKRKGRTGFKGTPNYQLEVSSTDGISSVRFHDSGNTFTLDDLYFQSGPGVKITLLPVPPDNTYLISSTPSMPVISAKADIIGVYPDPTAKTHFTWTATLTTVDGSGDVVDLSPWIDNKNNKTTGEATYTVQFKPGTIIVGGKLTLKASATTADGTTLTGQTPSNLMIRGTPGTPAQGDLLAYIAASVSKGISSLSGSDVADALERIACQESGQVQFNNLGDPKVSPDNGVGVFQITKTTKCGDGAFDSSDAGCVNAIFSWKVNVDRAVDNFTEKVKASKNYPDNLANNAVYQDYIKSFINPARAKNKLGPIDPTGVPKLAAVGILGTTDPATGVPNQLLEDAIRGYNGYGAGTLILHQNYDTGMYIHEFVPDENFLLTIPDADLKSLQKNPRFWTRFPAGSRQGPGDHKYIGNVTAKTPDCE